MCAAGDRRWLRQTMTESQAQRRHFGELSLYIRDLEHGLPADASSG
ncbi:hypothetical protein [Streptomyces sp. NPDC050738]